MEERKLKLYVDIDDVLVHSSPLIQKEVNANTIFKTEKLQIIEQIRRNVKYYRRLIEEECNKALKEMRLPRLNRFPNMNDNIYAKNFNYESIYYFPIKKAIHYERIVDMIYNQFLEERDMFLENDNLKKGLSKEYNYEEEHEKIIVFKNIVACNCDEIMAINDFCYNEAVRISNAAKEQKIIPDYGELVNVDNNDIIRTNVKEKSLEYYVYEKPVLDIKKCIGSDIFIYILKNFDIKRTPSEEIVDYDSIYTLKNTNLEAIRMIEQAMLSGMIDALYAISHHNGDRESYAKERLIKETLPRAKFIGLRFHEFEHNLTRRQRSSKFKVAKYLNDEYDNDLMLLLDDSKDNCKDWKSNDGNTILYRKITDAEKSSKMEKSEYNRITSFSDLENVIVDIHQEVNSKIKKIGGR